jgi:hypothetical protein
MRSSLGDKGLRKTWLRVGGPAYNRNGIGGIVEGCMCLVLPLAWSKGKVFTVDPEGDVKMMAAQGGVVSIALSPVSSGGFLVRCTDPLDVVLDRAVAEVIDRAVLMGETRERVRKE